MEKTLLNGHDGFRADHAGGSGWTQLKVARLIAGFDRYKIAVASGAAGQTAIVIAQGDLRLVGGRLIDIPRAQYPGGAGDLIQGKATGPV